MRVASCGCAALLVAACSGGPQNSSDWVAVRDTIGDTIVVRTVSGSTMGGLSYVEELSIGQLDGPPEYTFGQIGCLRADGSGGVFVFDMQVPALMQYDANGRYVRTVGRKGQGPGEYGRFCAGIQRHPDGGVVIADGGNLRVNVYSSEGEHRITFRMATQTFRGNAMDVDAEGRIYETGHIVMSRTAPRTEVVITHDPQGAIVDTLVVPVLPNEVRVGSFAWLPNQSTDFSPTLGLVISDPMTYTLHVDDGAGRVLRIEREAEPVVPFPEERDNWDRYASHYRARVRGIVDAFEQLPNRKPSIRNIRIMDDGRIWVQVYAPAEYVPSDEPAQENAEPAIEWREPNHYDVFEPDGAYIGRLELSRTERLKDANGDELWILRQGKLDESYVVRGRLIAR